ncbi:hypothetical protein chiPu_0015188 [Chiloscyllium punctatum]|uniref:Uncharacterized protein n=1 Tax=Chiloscyllium punctatum TaxID=137246 RepID=A0A401T230_CHIPU|nr:hypothetical protein [Chiloscyllium punctatum]
MTALGPPRSPPSRLSVCLPVPRAARSPARLSSPILKCPLTDRSAGHADGGETPPRGHVGARHARSRHAANHRARPVTSTRERC